MKDRPNIFLVSIDSLRPDFISLYNNKSNIVTPFFKELGKKSVVYENAYSAGLWTDPAITSIYTGLYPSQHRILPGSDSKLEENTLAEVLSNNGYKTIMVGTGSPYISLERKIVKGFDTLVDAFEINKIHNIRDIINCKANLKQISYSMIYNLIYGRDSRIFYSVEMLKHVLSHNNKNNIFFHLHLWFFNAWYSSPWKKKWEYLKKISDFDYTIYRSFINKIKKLKKAGIRVSHKFLCEQDYFDDNDIRVINCLYAASVFYVDSQLNKLFYWLENEGYLDNSILIITSDHGEMLGEHNLLSHNFSNFQEIIRVPLLVYAPGLLKPKRIKNVASHIDLAGSLLKLLDIKTELGGRGMNIFSDEFYTNHISCPIFFEDGKPADIKETLLNVDPLFDVVRYDYAIKGMIDGKYKYIVKSNNIEELYDLHKDKEEDNNIIGSNLKRANDMSKILLLNLGKFDSTNPTGL